MPRKMKNDLPDLDLVDTKTIGERIIEVRKYKGLTQEQLALKANINRSTLADYELNRSRIFSDILLRIAIALEVSTDSLLGLKKIEKKF